MELTQEQIDILRNFKNVPDSDDIRYKEIIKKTLINDQLIIYLLNNKALEEDEAQPSDYLGVNILPYYLIHPTQTDVQNYICYQIQFDQVDRYNSVMKYGEIIFYILCDQKTNIQKNTGIARHDLIAARIINDFNWSNMFGNQIHLVSDKPSVVDNDYAARTLIFQQTTTANIVQTGSDKKSRVVNNVPVRR